MPFAPLNVLVAVIPVDRSRFLDDLRTLGVYDRCRWLRIPAHALSLRCPKCGEDAVQHVWGVHKIMKPTKENQLTSCARFSDKS